METMLLREASISPSEKVLESALGKSYSIYEELMETITNKNYELIPQWNYYNDGKAWLCKVQFKKKTIFWLSVWDKYFKMAFYFTEKNCKGINELNIESNIKKDFARYKPVGRLLPLVMIVNRKEQLKDALQIIEYKKKIK